MGKLRQGKLDPLWKDSLHAVPGPPRLPPWKSLLRIAPSRRVWRSDTAAWDGWENSSGVIYIRCLFHREKTPSLAIYPRRPGARFGPEAAHYHCYGCHAHGSLWKFIKQLRNEKSHKYHIETNSGR